MDKEACVLIVDDNESNLLALEAVLESLDCGLVRAQSGTEALRALLKQDFAAILMDVNMPDMNGFETARAIRERERSKDVPIIFISAAYKDFGHVSQGYSLKAIDYLLKPFNPEILRTKVSVLVELHQKTIRLQEQTELLRQSEGRLEILVKERTAQLEAYATRLERSNRDLQDFAYIASHDLQEPLRKILAFGDRLADRYKDRLDETGLDYLTRMHGASHRMQVLINDLLTYSRLETQAQPFARVNLNEIVQEVLSNLVARIEKQQARVDVGSLPAIEADPTQMYQLFQNLISNALKFQEKEAVPEIQVTGEADGQQCRVWVRDNGIGFEIQFLDRIFKPFQRLHGHGEYEGTGMGLAICRRIVERHHGEITAESAPGQGAAFVITLPLHQSKGEHQ